MLPNPQETTDFVTFIKKNLNRKRHFLYSVISGQCYISLSLENVRKPEII